MKTTRWITIGAGLLAGSVLSLVPLAAAHAADHDLYESLQELTAPHMDAMHSQGSGMATDSSMTYGGPQGPVRDDMDKDKATAAPPANPPAFWDEIRKQLGPIGGN